VHFRKIKYWLFHIEPFADYRPFSMIMTAFLLLIVMALYWGITFACLEHCYAPTSPNWPLAIFTATGMAIFAFAFLGGHFAATTIDLVLFDIPRLIKKICCKS